jgi:succinate dehydrogenase flavin-adding protein (antitoxin of CptAB toxin-antitoxin module)
VDGKWSAIVSIKAQNTTLLPPLRICRHRLEVDLLLGTWAAKYVPSLTEPELAQYEALLNRETLDLYNYVTGREAPPPELAGPLLDGIVAFVKGQPLGRASQEVRYIVLRSFDITLHLMRIFITTGPSFFVQGYLAVKRNMSN